MPRRSTPLTSPARAAPPPLCGTKLGFWSLVSLQAERGGAASSTTFGGAGVLPEARLAAASEENGRLTPAGYTTSGCAAGNRPSARYRRGDLGSRSQRFSTRWDLRLLRLSTHGGEAVGARPAFIPLAWRTRRHAVHGPPADRWKEQAPDRDDPGVVAFLGVRRFGFWRLPGAGPRRPKAIDHVQQ